MSNNTNQYWGIPLWKRIFDILGASFLLLCLSPLFLGIAVLIKLESKGPVFYSSKRIGQGFQAFDFYKFRSMQQNAGSMLDQIKKLNQYAKHRVIPQAEATPSGPVLVNDNTVIQEGQHRFEKEQVAGFTFLKVNNDPRITRIGKFIRSTSIDELPQLWNVLKGDMSLVGNRPLPLYEAEKLTLDNAILRFKAPAGITGLWQVNGRGKKTVSEEERKQFDIEYAQNYNLNLDLKILWRTLPAAVQEANV